MQNITFNGTQNMTAVTANETPNTAPSPPEYFQEPVAVTVFQISLWSSIALVGVIGNLLVCLVVLRRLKMTSMNYHLLSLAVADLGVLIIIYPTSVSKYISPHRWLFGKLFCLYMIPTEEIFFGASIWSITAIAIERYRNVVGAGRYQFWKRSRFRAGLAIMCVWLASFLVSSVPLYPLMRYHDSGLCQVDWPKTSGKHVMLYAYQLALFIVWYVLPLAVVAFTYLKIKERVRDSNAFRNSMALENSHEKIPPREKRIWRRSYKTRRILSPLVILFAVTMFPLNAFRLFILFNPDFRGNKYYNLVFAQVGLFVVINSSANPLVYYITSKEFKEAFKSILINLRKKNGNIFNQFRLSRALSWRFSMSSGVGETTENLAKVNNNESNYRGSATGPVACTQFESAI